LWPGELTHQNKVTRVAEEDALDFGALLRAFRLARTVSQEELAGRSRLSVQSVSALERGARRAPYRHTVNALADGLGLNPDEREQLVRAAARPRGPRKTKRGGGPVVRFPAYGTAFVGRERECREIATLAGRSRIVTICGFGGVGKTRLAVEVGRDLSLTAGRETVFVDFCAVRAPAQVVARIAAEFRLADAPADTALGALTAALSARDVMLVLDNCESVIDECARVVETLVRGCPRVRVIATSREPLQIDGEALYRLDSLERATAAVDLFVDRIVASGNADAPDRALATAIATRLDGIPLALELAAGLARTRSLTEILDALSGADFLTMAERRSTVGHHRTMHAAIEWSYAALSDDERTDLRLLAYPEAGTSREGACALCARQDDRILRRLVSASLVLEDRVSGRFRLHELTRQFVAPLAHEAEMRAAADRYALYLARRMRAAFDAGWQGASGDPLEPFLPLVAELDNVRQAFSQLLATGNLAVAAELAAGPDYWTVVGRVPEGYEWLARVRALGGEEFDGPASVPVHFGLALCAIQAGRAPEAVEHATRAGELAERHGLPVIAGRSRITLGHVALARGDASAAADHFQHASARLTDAGSESGTARARIFLAFALIELGEAARAEAIAREHARRQRERYGSLAGPERCFVEILLADVARLRGDLAGSLEHGRAALEAYDGGPITSIYARAVHGRAEALVVSGSYDEAERLMRVRLREFHERGFRTEVALLLEVAALLYLRRSRPRDAARIAYLAEAILSAARRTRTRFARETHAEVHARLAADLGESERAELRAAAAADRASDVLAFIHAVREVCE
jgi:predicted ATPase